MSGSTFGKLFTITTWGESHGEALGVVIDGCPAGVPLTPLDIQLCMDRRRPGASEFSTKRAETDAVQVLSGVFEGKTTGAPISLLIFNEDARSRDYSAIADIYRPSHADYGFDAKYGFRDYRGGGRSSGRETAARVAAGAVAKCALAHLGVDVTAYTVSVGNVCIDRARFDKREITENALAMPDAIAAREAALFVRQTMAENDSAGGVIECVISGVPAGVGEPVFRKLDAALAQATLSIGAVKGIEFGSGFNSAYSTGSVNNDAFYYDGAVKKRTNNAGGVSGGLSDGADIIFRAAVKPTPSIGKPQHTVNRRMENVEARIEGRHDPLIAPRAVVVVECMAAIVTLDLMMENMLSRIEGMKRFYLL